MINLYPLSYTLLRTYINSYVSNYEACLLDNTLIFLFISENVPCGR
jgi:hypothetical protein